LFSTAAVDQEDIMARQPDATALSPEDQQKQDHAQALLKRLRYYGDAQRYVERLEDALGSVCDMMASKMASDVIAAIDLIVLAHKYKLRGTDVSRCTVSVCVSSIFLLQQPPLA
jgi:hypothetical protein